MNAVPSMQRFLDSARGLGLGVCLGGVVVMPMAHADDYDWMLQVLDNTRIGGNVGAGASGNVAINTAAGDNNLQSNQRHMQVSAGSLAGSALPSAGGRSLQVQGNRASSGGVLAQSEISGHAFNNASGALGINQVSGANNAQMNTMSVGGAAGRPLQEIRPSGPVTPVQTPNPADQKSGRPVGHISNQYRAVIGEGALSGISGVLQINQVSGIGNVTANHFSISMP